MTPIAQMVGAVAHFPVIFVFTSWADDINLSPAPASSHAFTCCEEICATADHQLLSCVTVNPLSAATWLLLPHFLLLPLDHGPLVDLALNPNLITIDNLHVIVSSFATQMPSFGTLPSPRHFHSCCLHGNKMHVHGGHSGKVNFLLILGHKATLSSCSMSTSTWFGILFRK